jgi:transposase
MIEKRKKERIIDVFVQDNTLSCKEIANMCNASESFVYEVLYGVPRKKQRMSIDEYLAYLGEERLAELVEYLESEMEFNIPEITLRKEAAERFGVSHHFVIWATKNKTCERKRRRWMQAGKKRNKKTWFK